VSHIEASLRLGLAGTMPHAASRPGRDTARYNSVRVAMREEPGEKGVHLGTVSEAPDVQSWFTIETLPNPCNALSDEAGSTSTMATAGSRQRWVSTSSSSVSEQISGSRRRQQPCLLHVGPWQRKGCFLGMASCRCLILGRRWPGIQRQPHTLAICRASAHQGLAERGMHMQATWRMAVRSRRAVEDALKMQLVSQRSSYPRFCQTSHDTP
jgi:hypothetical protein